MSTNPRTAQKRIPSMANLAKGSKKPEAPKIEPPAPETQEQAPVPEELAASFYKLKNIPRGGALTLYIAASIKALDGWASTRPSFKGDELSKLVTKRHYDFLINSKTIEELKDGAVKLSKDGWTYYDAMINGSAAVKDSKNAIVDRLAAAIKSGKYEGGRGPLANVTMQGV